LTRTILHLDMDAFFASVELLRRPDLRGRPVVVGGAGPRGVVAAASYEARTFGVHSAMAMSRARRACPDLVVVPPDHGHYAEVSARIMAVLRECTPLVEPLSLDEAFLDVSGATRLFGDGVMIGHRIRADVRDELQLGCSVGVASNKFLAKLASVAAKPVATRGGVAAGPGVVAVEPGRELEFLHPLPVERLWGVGPATLERLDRLAVRTVGDLTRLDESILTATLGKSVGRHLRALSEGRDERPVEPDRRVKSIGHEETFASDVHTYDELNRELVRMADAVASRLRAAGRGARTLTLKVRFAGFRTITRSITGTDAVDTGPAITSALRPLLAEVDPAAGVRLLGVSSSNFASPSTQLSLLDAPPGAGAGPAVDPVTDHLAAGAIDEIRERFGAGAIGPASAVDRRGLRVVRPGSQQWGPDDPPAR
jgi:DNA polymerase IV